MISLPEISVIFMPLGGFIIGLLSTPIAFGFGQSRAEATLKRLQVEDAQAQLMRALARSLDAHAATGSETSRSIARSLDALTSAIVRRS